MIRALTSACRFCSLALHAALSPRRGGSNGRRKENRNRAADWIRCAASRGALGLLVSSFAAAPAAAATHYLYDDLGRLVLAASPEQGSVVYDYDANGNVTAIIRWASTSLAIAGFSPTSGHAGQLVTIHGGGFDATPSANQVTIGGVTATVNTATATTLSVTVPYGALTGPISVTANGDMVTSAQNYFVRVPSITSFAPVFANPGTAVTLSGDNFNLVPGGTSLSVGGSPVALTSLSNVEATFAAPSNGGGPITLATPYGQATSESALFVLPSFVNAANVVDYDETEVGGGGVALSINQQSRSALFTFDATAGQNLSVQLVSMTTAPSSGANVAYEVRSPSGTMFASGSVSSSNRTIHLPVIATPGRYWVSFASGSSTSVQIAAEVEVNSWLDANGTSLSVAASGPAQSKRVFVNLTAGDDVGFALTGLSSSSPSYVRFTVYRPSGAAITNNAWCARSSTPGCSFALLNLPETGTYRIVVNAEAGWLASYTLTLSHDVTETLSLGSPSTVNLDVPGRQGWLNFSATAGQTLALNMSSIATTPNGKQVTMRVYNASGGQVATVSSTTGATLNLPNLAAGNYNVLLLPADAATATVQVHLADGLIGAVPTDGTSQSFSSTVPGQHGYFTFTANAGDDLGFALTGLTSSSPSYVYFTIYRPSGAAITNNAWCARSSTPGCSFALLNLPETGTYRIIVYGESQWLASYTLTLSPDVTETLSLGSPSTVNLDVPGRQGWLNFSATAGQTVALNMSSIATTPSGKQVTMRVYNASGGQVATVSNATGATLNLNNLAAGTYHVLLWPADAATASVIVQIQ